MSLHDMGGEWLIKANTAETEVLAQGEASFTNPNFLESHGLRWERDEPELDDHLSHAIATQPTQLLAHTRRIFLKYWKKDGDGLYSALVDLFLVLGQQKGYALRKRLLWGSRDRLSACHFQALRLWLNAAETPQEADIPPASQSLFLHGVRGSLELVTLFEQMEYHRDPLIEAREYIEFSQLEEARSLLEASVLQQPTRDDLLRELLELYNATRDTVHYLAMRAKLLSSIGRLPPYWIKFEDLLQEQETL
jgi:hypothetical protein